MLKGYIKKLQNGSFEINATASGYGLMDFKKILDVNGYNQAFIDKMKPLQVVALKETF